MSGMQAPEVRFCLRRLGPLLCGRRIKGRSRQEMQTARSVCISFVSDLNKRGIIYAVSPLCGRRTREGRGLFASHTKSPRPLKGKNLLLLGRKGRETP